MLNIKLSSKATSGKVGDGVESRMGLAAGGSVAAMLAASGIQLPLSNSIIRGLNVPKETVLSNLKRGGFKGINLMDGAPRLEDALPKWQARFLRKYNPAQAATIEAGLRNSPGFYSMHSKKIHVGKKTSEAIMLHELGHAKQHKALGKSMLPITAVSQFAHKASPFAGIGLAAFGSDKHRKKSLLLGSLMAAPNLLIEGGASHSAIKGLRKMHGGSYWKNLTSPAGKSLLKALGTYAALPAAGVAAGLGINAIRDAMARKRANNGS